MSGLLSVDAIVTCPDGSKNVVPVTQKTGESVADFKKRVAAEINNALDACPT